MGQPREGGGGGRGYSAGPPWIFSGRALYQLHLVKAEVARKSIPSELNLVQAFGYTLGGIFLANYENSPAGTFDELVVISGIVWNPPTSCAWAGRVLVSSKEARDHGRQVVGLPSRLSKFEPTMKLSRRQNKQAWWKPSNRVEPETNTQTHGIDVLEMDRLSPLKLCHVDFPTEWTQLGLGGRWKGPPLKMSLPSYSGRTEQRPQLLNYSCDLKCRVQIMKPAIVIPYADSDRVDSNKDRDCVLSVLGAKPLLALAFEEMKMSVQAPREVIIKKGRGAEEHPNTRFKLPISTSIQKK